MPLDLDLLPAESATHRTSWRLEKRAADVDLFIASNLREVEAVLAGRRNWSLDIDPRRIREEAALIQQWAVEQGGPTRELFHSHEPMARSILHREFLRRTPAVVVEREGNILVTAGITLFLALLTGGGGTVYSNANAALGVGDSSTAAAVGQTDLIAGSNFKRKAMNATYPTIAAPVINFQSTFGSTDANYVWNEVATFNNVTDHTGTMLNRVVQALGTKSGGSTWTLTETITWS